MNHQGDILKKAVKESEFTQAEFADMMGVSRNYLIVLFKERKINQKYLEIACKLLNINISIFEATTTNEHNPGNSPSEAIYERLIKALQDQIEMLKEDAAIIKKDTETFRTIVERGVAEGAIKFVKPNSK